MSQLRQHENEFRQLEVIVAVVTFDSASMARGYQKSTGVTWPILLDPERRLYAAYGFERLGWWGHLNPVSLARYLWLMMRGHFPGRPGADWRQLGGNVLIDPQGIVRLVHRSRDSHDRPSPRSILEQIGSSPA